MLIPVVYLDEEGVHESGMRSSVAFRTTRNGRDFICGEVRRYEGEDVYVAVPLDWLTKDGLSRVEAQNWTTAVSAL